MEKIYKMVAERLSLSATAVKNTAELLDEGATVPFISRYLKEAGIRPTPNRVLVLRSLLKSDYPLSLTDLETSLDTLDKSSVFRVLTLLLEHGVVHGVEDGRGVTRYEICRGDHSRPDADDDLHAHFYCERCNKVYCFPQINTPRVNIPEGFTAHSVNFMIKGVCPRCRKD